MSDFTSLSSRLFNCIRHRRVARMHGEAAKRAGDRVATNVWRHWMGILHSQQARTEAAMDAAQRHALTAPRRPVNFLLER